MAKSRFIAILSMVCLMFAMVLVPSVPVNKASAETSSDEDSPDTDFFTSFEKGDPQPTWEDTVETTPDGNKKASGVDGNIQYDAIQGDITDKVESIKADDNNPPNEVDSNLIDRNDQTKWLGFHATAKITMKFSEPEAVIKYAFTSANDHQGRDPQDWTLYGSNDGESWTKLDSQSGVSFEKRFQRKIFKFDNDTKYTYYRFDITKNAGEDITQLAEIALSNGIDVPPPPPSPMKSHVGEGPTSSYTAKTHVGWTGKKTLTYAGTHLEKGRAYSYNKLFDVNIKVTPETQLSYYIHPQFMDKDQLDYSSTYVSIDLAFTDGTYLSDLGAKDQHRVKLTPQAQGESNTVYPNQWNYRVSDIGKVAAGKTIDRILVAYDNPNGPGEFQGSIDDIKINGHPEQQTYSSPIDYVNILRGTNANGTFSRGNNIPAVAVPHGFNFWIPATNAGSTSWLYTYQQGNNEDNLPEIQAFSLSHEPSPWMGDRQTFQVMPSASTADKPPLNRDKRALAFKHSNEIAKPNYYSVTFENGMKTEITPTNHAAMFRFTFTGDQSNLIFDNVNNNGGLTLEPDKQSIQGYTDVKSGLSTGATRMFVYATFDKPVADSGKLTGENRDNVAGYFHFNTSESDKTVTMKIATSLISVDQAKKNLNQEIHPNDTFASVKERAKEQWNSKLNKIEVEGATDDELVTLYSNMYRLYLYPNKMYENTGTAEDPDYKYASAFSDPVGKPTATETGAKIVKGKPYVNNGFWDTYRTAWPAYTLLSPKEAGEMIDGFVQQYRDGGWISRWSSPGYADLMTGTSADVAFADAYLKGVTNFDVNSFYKAAIKDASVVSPNSGTGRKGLSTSIFDGYTNTDTGQGMSWAMAGYLNDFAIANISKKLAEQTDKNDPKHDQYSDNYTYYINRAQNYVNMFNPNVGFFMGRKPSGEWRTTPDKYDPRDWAGDYTETNAWGMAFDAPYDGQGLANLYGGREGLAEKLDKFFSTQETATHPEGYLIHEMREARDVRMGMYAQSNQPAHHIIYMYDYAGQPWKTQEKIREVLSRLFIGSEIGQGYPGDEDNGEMSAWYIFSAAGFYPLSVGSPSYAIGAPYFKKMTIHLENGKDIVINAPNVSDTNKYIQSMKLNGKPYNKLTIDHKDLVNGATLDFEMGSKPSEWGTGEDALPSSITPSSKDGSSSVPKPLKDLTDKLISEDKGAATDSEDGDTKQLFDNTSKSQWTVKSQTPFIQYQFREGQQEAQMYTLTSAKDNQAADPKSWVLKGSNDGDKWTVLDKRTNETFNWRLYTRPFEIEHPGKYSYYKLEITDNNGDSSTSLAEVELLGHQYEKAPVTGFVPDQKVVVQPGGDTTFKLGVKNTTDNKVDVDWKASLPKGLSLSPKSGTLTVDAGESQTTTVSLKASKDMPEGIYTIPVHLTTGSESWPDLYVKVYVASPGNLLPYFNNTGISKDSNPNANFDLVGFSYSEQALKDAGITPGGTVTHDGVDFKWPNVAPNTPDNVLADGQTIQVMGNGPKLSFLGSASHGPSKGTGTIQYTDGTVQKFQLGFSDWTLNGGSKQPDDWNELVASMPYRNSQSGKSNTKNYLFYTSVPLDADKMVESITLPDSDSIDQGEIHLFAMSIKYSSPQDIADMEDLIDRFEDEGAFANHGAAQALHMHLVAVNHFAEKGEAEKVVKHLKGFDVLLDHQKKNELISEEAYHALKVDTDYLITKWENR
jgi:predicted alpha-1,2-mannosidase